MQYDICSLLLIILEGFRKKRVLQVLEDVVTRKACLVLLLQEYLSKAVVEDVLPPLEWGGGLKVHHPAVKQVVSGSTIGKQICTESLFSCTNLHVPIVCEQLFLPYQSLTVTLVIVRVCPCRCGAFLQDGLLGSLLVNSCSGHLQSSYSPITEGQLLKPVSV